MKRFLLASLIVLLSVSFVHAEYFDFGGATITILNQSHHPAHRFIEGDWPGMAKDGFAYGLHEEAEALFNCNIEFRVFGHGEYIEALMTRLLSGDAANDIWIMNSNHYFPLLAQGALFPVSTVLPQEYFENLTGMVRGTAEFMTFRGETYSFGMTGAGALGGLGVVVYNRDTFDELGLPDLQDLYEQGEWTWEALGDIAERGTRQDGESILYGVSGLVDHSYFYGFAYTNDRAAWVEEQDGQMIFTGNQAPYLEALNQVRDWVDRGIHRPTVNRNPDQVAVLEGSLPILFTNAARFYNNAVAAAADSAGRYGIVPMPRGPRSDVHYHVSNNFDTALTLPVTADHPEGLIQLATFLYPPEDYDILLQELIQTFAQDRRTAGILREMHDEWSGWVNPMVDRASGMITTRTAVIDVLNGRATASTAMDAVASEQQAILDDLWNF